MSVIDRVATSAVYVSDQDAALDFYVNRLGFEKAADDPMGDGLRWVEVVPPGAETRVVLVHGYGGWSPERVGQFASLTYETADLEAAYRELSARGVVFVQPPTPQPWGSMAQFRDQDGNTFVLAQRA
jgi:predicted enzyme related to lactoylglutathione lyase